jgi:O-antigen/teichoic acid export membrane protein
MDLRLLKKIYKDKALIWGFLFLSWSFVSGPITSILVLILLSPEVQGYYFLFIQLSILAQLGDMGLNVVLYFMIARSYGKIKKNILFYHDYENKNSIELVSIMKFVYRYSIIIPFLIFPIIYFIGIEIFSQRNSSVSNFGTAWLILCLAMSIDISTTFFSTQIEAFNKIKLSNQLKLLKVVIRSISLWIFLYIGLNLESIGYSILISVLTFSILYLIIFRNLVLGVLKSNIKKSITWSRDIWPLQWKTSLSFLFGAIILYNSSIAAAFYFLGAVQAGMFGISLAIIEAIIAVCTLMFNVIQPKIAYLINDNKYSEIKEILLNRVIYAILLTIILGGIFYISMIFLEIYLPHYYKRFLPKEYLYLLILSGILRHIVCAISIFIRAHKSEFLMPAFISAGVSVIVLNLILIPNYGLYGVCLTYFLVKLIFHLPPCIYLLIKFLQKNKIFFTRIN